MPISSRNLIPSLYRPTRIQTNIPARRLLPGPLQRGRPPGRRTGPPPQAPPACRNPCPPPQAVARALAFLSSVPPPAPVLALEFVHTLLVIPVLASQSAE